LLARRRKNMRRVVVLAPVLALAVLGGASSDARANSCPADRPYLVTAAKFQGFLTVCSDADQTSLTIRNAANVVYRVWPSAYNSLTLHANSDLSLLGEATRTAAPPRCYQRLEYCILEPGGSADVHAAVGFRAQASVYSDAAATGTTLAARLVAGQIDRRLRPVALRRMNSVMTCAKSISATMNADGWQFALRSGVDVASSCPGLMSDLDATQAERTAWSARVTRVGARVLKQEGFFDAVFSFFKAVVRR
jgi:hypothetical protein